MSWLGCRQSSSQLSLSRSVSSAAYGEVMAGCERLGVVMYGRQRGGGRLSSGGRPQSSSTELIESFRSAALN